MNTIVLLLGMSLTAMAGAPKSELKAPETTAKEAHTDEMVTMPAWDFTRTTADGQEVKLSDFKGKVVLLDFWASWSESCTEEFPFLVKLHNILKEKDFTVLGVNLDIEREKMQDFVAGQAIKPEFPIIYDQEDSLPRLYDVNSMPTMILIDKEGNIRFRHTGFSDLEKKKILAEIITLLN